MTGSVTDGVRLAPAVTGWPGVAPGWSRRITVSGHTWHYLDNAASLPDSTTPRGTLLCVHGNPTWSYLWRSVLDAGARAGWRVVAVDQLEMGFSEHTGADHRLADRVRQLGDLTDTLGLSGDGWDRLGVVILGHDWGGVVSTGWAVDHPRELAGLALTNTAIHQPAEVKVPSLLRLARRPGVHSVATTLTPAFLDVTLRLARPPLADEVMRAYRSPYRTAHDRHGIGAFVADIPVDAAHPSHRELARIAAGVAELTVPALLIWGAKDPVFDERYLRDLIARLPHADVHRFSDAGHLVVEDADVAGTVMRWLAAHALPSTTAELASSRPISSADLASLPSTTADLASLSSTTADLASLPSTTADLASLPSTTAARHSRAVPKATAPSSARSASDEPAPYRPVYGALLDQAGSHDPAIVALHAAGRETVSWSELASRVHHLALGLNDAGVRPGHRVSLLVPPGVDLTTALFACLRLGAVVILADAGLGTRGLTLAVRGSAPDHIIGIERALVGARLLRWPGRRLLSEPRADGAATRPERVQARGDATTLGRVRRRALGLSGTVEELLARGAELAAGGAELAAGGATLPPEPDAHADAAILFTSGSTGPAKGVVYTHERLFRMCAAVADAYGLSRERGLVAGFAPFSLLGTGLGALTSIPDMD
ncbi:MAG: alpha/beta fold hydrolase, partial [Actinomycetales bacterium]|nr:alpha/beta fold hydrolase [Actinomycetales bacterium]